MIKKTFIYSFKNSIPILISFIPVGLVYGILMQTAGYDFMWSGVCSILVFAGSLQYLMISFFTSDVTFITVAAMALLLNSRHCFYGIPFIKKWKDYGISKYFLIYSLADECFSLHISVDESRNDINPKLAYIFNGILVLGYWAILSVMGGLIGAMITIDTSGIDFALTALFIVITIEQIKSADKKTLPAVIAAISSVAFLSILGPDSFILPSLLATVVCLLLFRPAVERTVI